MKTTQIKLTDRLIFALDLPTMAAGMKLLGRLKGTVTNVKIGLELFTAEGPQVVAQAKSMGFRVFLDLKFHDIPTTVERSVASVARLGADMITVHTIGGLAMLRAAQEGAEKGAASAKTAPPLVLGVTVLTSMSDAELAAVNVRKKPMAQAVDMAMLAKKAGIGGIVCSPAEVHKIRSKTGGSMRIVTPGIRPGFVPEGGGTDDHSRSATPFESILAGSDYLVVGRPVRDAEDPARAAEEILYEIERALDIREG